MRCCSLCPRKCAAPRGERSGEGFCGAGTLPVVARAAAHRWEEPCISGARGSGTVFFSGCTLGCVFCQNLRVSRRPVGRALTPAELCELFARVEALGVHNLNLVTPTHYTPAIVEALRMRRPGVPVVWNTSGYERVETLRALRGLVDVYLPDFKYASPATGRALASAEDYYEVTLRAIQEMRAQTGEAAYDSEGMLVRGTLVRHLILPLRTGESLRILDAVATRLPPGTPVSLMRQYTPMADTREPGLNRRLTPREYARVRDHMLALGLEGYLQSKEAATDAYTPDFLSEESMRLLDGLGTERRADGRIGG